MIDQQLSLIACHECDLLLADQPEAGSRGVLVCPRCGAVLYRLAGNSMERILALTLTALILLSLVNSFPIIELNLQGHHAAATLIGAAFQLWRLDMWGVAVLLLTTTVTIPLFELLVVGWLAWHLGRGVRPAGFCWLSRALQLAKPWAMVEVFLFGVVVALVKLSHLADLVLGPAMFCLVALMLVFTLLDEWVQPHEMWQAWECAA